MVGDVPYIGVEFFGRFADDVNQFVRELEDARRTDTEQSAVGKSA
jgi:hypothetical protein